MAKVTYIEFNGTEHVVDLQPGTTVMQGAVGNGVRGIIGDCGGACSCATCHCYVEPTWFDKVGVAGEMEMAMLEEVCEAKPNSRLSCQIQITDDLNGLVVRLPEKQV